jgi:hypothetical protein
MPPLVPGDRLDHFIACWHWEKVLKNGNAKVAL